MRWFSIKLGIVFLLLLVGPTWGCSDDAPMDAGADARAEDTRASDLGADAPSAARLELGTGTSSFVPLPEASASLELVLGPQRGWHLDVGVRFFELDPDEVTLSYEVRDAKDALLSVPTRIALSRRRVVPEAGGFVRVGDRVVLDISAPDEVEGQTVSVIGIIETPDSEAIRDGRTVMIVDLLE